MTGLEAHLVFALGGGLGAVARHGVSVALRHPLPWATFVVNVVGSFALGLVLVMVPGEAERLAVGFTGGFTTFSSFAYQTLDLHRGRTLWHAAANVAGNLVACLLALLAGRAIGMLIAV